MFVRTIRSTVTFTRPFVLSGRDGIQPPGTYTVETDEEVLQTESVRAYRRTSTLMRFPAGADVTGGSHIISVDAAELRDALASDCGSAGVTSASSIRADGEHPDPAARR
jgi:hypothetical protein